VLALKLKVLPLHTGPLFPAVGAEGAPGLVNVIGPAAVVFVHPLELKYILAYTPEPKFGIVNIPLLLLDNDKAG
jgi:hypothetical protein